jgi:hypothetical protein
METARSKRRMRAAAFCIVGSSDLSSTQTISRSRESSSQRAPGSRRSRRCAAPYRAAAAARPGRRASSPEFDARRSAATSNRSLSPRSPDRASAFGRRRSRCRHPRRISLVRYSISSPDWGRPASRSGSSTAIARLRPEVSPFAPRLVTIGAHPPPGTARTRTLPRGRDSHVTWITKESYRSRQMNDATSTFLWSPPTPGMSLNFW